MKKKQWIYIAESRSISTMQSALNNSQKTQSLREFPLTVASEYTEDLKLVNHGLCTEFQHTAQTGQSGTKLPTLTHSSTMVMPMVMETIW